MKTEWLLRLSCYAKCGLLQYSRNLSCEQAQSCWCMGGFRPEEGPGVTSNAQASQHARCAARTAPEMQAAEEGPACRVLSQRGSRKRRPGSGLLLLAVFRRLWTAMEKGCCMLRCMRLALGCVRPALFMHYYMTALPESLADPGRWAAAAA